jgi:hypothetical protein
MAFNGSGTFDPPAAPDYPAVSGDVIYATRFNTVMQEVFDGLSECITKSGQTVITADLDFSNKQIRNLEAIVIGSAVDDGVNQLQVTGKGKFTDAVTGVTAAPGTNDTKFSTTAFVANALGSYATSAAVAATYAPKASPTFTGTPAGPTATPGASTTQLATTAFVTGALGNYMLTSEIVTNYAPKASPTLTGALTLNVSSIALSASQEGTFTPTVYGNDVVGTAGGLTTFGNFTRYGKTVHFRLFISWGTHTGSGMIRIGNLPFSSANVSNSYAPVCIYADSIVISGTGYTIQGYIEPNTNSITIYNTPFNGDTTLPVLMENNSSGQFIISGSYWVA